MGWPEGLQKHKGVILIKYYGFIYLCILVVLLSVMTFHLFSHLPSYSAAGFLLCITLQRVIFSIWLYIQTYHSFKCVFEMDWKKRSSCPTQRVNSSLGMGETTRPSKRSLFDLLRVFQGLLVILPMVTMFPSHCWWGMQRAGHKEKQSLEVTRFGVASVFWKGSSHINISILYIVKKSVFDSIMPENLLS